MFGMIPYTHTDRSLFDYLDQMEKNYWDGSISSNMQFRCDIRETETGFVLEAELPGFERENIGLNLDGDTLVISAHREEKPEHKDTYLRRERKYGTFSRSFDVTGIDTNAIRAAYRNGILELTLPKKQPQAPASRRIEIMGE